MTPEEIRAISETVDKLPDAEPLHQARPTMSYSSSQFVILREIAAQLAEQNAMQREALDMRKTDDANVKAFREQSLAQVGPMKFDDWYLDVLRELVC